mmetsp:Transcript_31687/g.98658  ORF Transcript_31687/g.98658 Transcript_31687/m.98658 type:complete len:213 (+) Transcript_31687:1307-1945(+)
MCSARLTGVTSSIPPANCARAQRKDMMYRYSKASSAKSCCWSQFHSTREVSPKSFPMMYHTQAMRCPVPSMMTMSLRTSTRTTSLSEGSRSASKFTISPTLASLSRRIMRMMRKIRVTLLSRPTSMPSNALPRMISVQSALTTATSSRNHDLKYFTAMRQGRISMVPSMVTNPETKDMGMSNVQNTRVVHSRMIIPVVTSGSKKPKGTMTMS